MARPRALFPIDRIPLVGGSVCLDFVNTCGARGSGLPRERLAHYRDLLVWSQRAGILEEKAAATLRGAAARRRDEAGRALARARAVRESLYALFSTVAAGRRPGVDVVSDVDRHWRAARNRQELVAAREGFEIRFVASVEFDCIVHAIVLSAAELLTSDRLRGLTRCAECDWLFVDKGRNGTRRWCKPMCGNRARSRERYGRLRKVTFQDDEAKRSAK